MKLRMMVCIAGLGTLILLTGCARKFTKDRFSMITVGVDDREDVRMMIGEPRSKLDDQWLYDDLDDHYSALVHFDDDGKVSGKEWIDSVTGDWEGRNPHADKPPKGEVREHHTKTRQIDDD